MIRSVAGPVSVFLLFALSCSRPGGESASETAASGSEAQDDPIEIEMIHIPAGSFMMGSNNADDEDPIHEVRVSEFFIGKYPVTQRQWQEVMGSNPSAIIGDDLPVESVSWDDVQLFVARLNERTGEVYRLPTEAEWEYAARAGSTTDFHFGSDTLELGEYGWYLGNSDSTTHPVGQKRPNAWGLYDVVGNVREWCQDWWDPDFYHRSESVDPLNDTAYLYTSPSTGEQFVVRVTRSGSYRDIPSGNESAHRHGGNPVRGNAITGFRLARDVRW